MDIGKELNELGFRFVDSSADRYHLYVGNGMELYVWNDYIQSGDKFFKTIDELKAHLKQIENL